MSYIIDQDSKVRESVAIHRLLATMALRDQLFEGLSWFIMELQFSTLGLDEVWGSMQYRSGGSLNDLSYPYEGHTGWTPRPHSPSRS